jgi:hypothetical protein
MHHEIWDHLMHGSIGRFAGFAHVVVFVVQTPTAYVVSSNPRVRKVRGKRVISCPDYSISGGDLPVYIRLR